MTIAAGRHEVVVAWESFGPIWRMTAACRGVASNPLLFRDDHDLQVAVTKGRWPRWLAEQVARRLDAREKEGSHAGAT